MVANLVLYIVSLDIMCKCDVLCFAFKIFSSGTGYWCKLQGFIFIKKKQKVTQILKHSRFRMYEVLICLMLSTKLLHLHYGNARSIL